MLVWIALHSDIRVSNCPFSHSSNRLLRQSVWSLALKLYFGFCSAGIIITAFKAILHRNDSFVQLSSKCVVSRIKSFPTLPDGIKKRFFRQWTISSYIALMIRSISASEYDPPTSGWGCWISTFGWILTTLLEPDALYLF